MFFCRRKPYHALNKALFSANRSTPEPYFSEDGRRRKQKPADNAPYLFIPSFITFSGKGRKTVDLRER